MKIVVFLKFGLSFACSGSWLPNLLGFGSQFCHENRVTHTYTHTHIPGAAGICLSKQYLPGPSMSNKNHKKKVWKDSKLTPPDLSKQPSFLRPAHYGLPDESGVCPPGFIRSAP